MLKGKLHMSIISKRLVSIAASTLVLSLVSASANAQIDVFQPKAKEYFNSGESISTYNFTSSMILNSIDFSTDGFSNVLSYKIGTGEYQFVDNSLLSTKDANGYQRIYLGALTVDSGTQVKIRINGNTNYLVSNQTLNSGSNVTYGGSTSTGFGTRDEFSNSNLRVYNPGSTVPGASVAPEPGSFALALTGGAALLGICVRRRRNAG